VGNKKREAFRPLHCLTILNCADGAAMNLYLARLQIAVLKIKPLNRKARQAREDKGISFAFFARLAVKKKRKTCPRSA
jgi:hypothetical protein